MTRCTSRLHRILRALAWTLASLTTLAACGGGGGAPEAAPLERLVGGAVQSSQGLRLAGIESAFAGDARASEPSSRDGIGPAARFVAPLGIATDGAHLYLVDGQDLRRIGIASMEVSGLTLRDAAGQAARPLRRPAGITTDGAHLYVADMGAHVVWKVAIATGRAAVLSGEPGVDDGGVVVDGPGPSARLHTPRAITVAGDALYVADQRGVRRIDARTGHMTTWFHAVGGAAPDTRFDVQSLCTDGRSLFMTDGLVILGMDLSTAEGRVVAGAFVAGPAADGVGTAARFGDIRALLCDGRDLHVVDHGNRSLRRVALPAGEVKTLGTLPAAGDAATDPADVQGLSTDGRSLFAVDRVRRVVSRWR